MRSFQATLVTTSQRQRHLCVHLILFAFLVLASGAAHSTTIFFEEFADNSAGWTLNTEWQIGPAMSEGRPRKAIQIRAWTIRPLRTMESPAS